MKRFWLWLYLCIFSLHGLAYSQKNPTPPTAGLTAQQLKEFVEAQDCKAKVAEWQKWNNENIPIHNAVVAENQSLKAELASAYRYFSFGIGTGIGSVGALCVLVWIYRKRLMPKTARGKQVSVLIPAALWTSFCFLGIANDSDLMLHPINAAVTALFWASPAFLFGWIAFWWFSPQRSA